jgi:hypothetical protein
MAIENRVATAIKRWIYTDTNSVQSPNVATGLNNLVHPMQVSALSLSPSGLHRHGGRCPITARLEGSAPAHHGERKVLTSLSFPGCWRRAADLPAFLFIGDYGELSELKVVD